MVSIVKISITFDEKGERMDSADQDLIQLDTTGLGQILLPTNLELGNDFMAEKRLRLLICCRISRILRIGGFR
jgi:hypothetical protein